MGRLDGKVALITGGARGMGKSHVRHFVAEGARVVFGDVLDDRGNYVAAGIGDEHCRYVHHDVTSEDGLGRRGRRRDRCVRPARHPRQQRRRAEVRPHHRNAAGGLPAHPRGQRGRLLAGHEGRDPGDEEAGGGSIVNISSVEGFTGAAGLSAYSASKFAIRGMTKAAARELGEYKIRVNSVHPGGVLTRMVLDTGGTNYTGDDDGTGFLKAMPLARFAEPAEISRLVAFLASDDSSYSTGSEFIADGGMLSGPGY